MSAVNLGRVADVGEYLKLRNLGNSYTQEMKDDISSGSFNICKVGCYLTINGTKYIFAHPDYWLNKGGPNNKCTTHHMAVITEGIVGSGKMASSSSTPYSSSYMRSNLHSTYKPQLQTDFGSDNILSINAGLVSGLSSSGYPNNWGYYTSELSPLTQVMLFGSLYCFVYASSINPFYNIGIENDQLELFAKRPDLIPIAGVKYWLRDVYNSTNYVVVTDNGAVSWDTYSTSNGIRIVFAIC